MADGTTIQDACREIAQRIKDGTIVPFLGAGASVPCGLPSGKALAQSLIERVSYPDDAGRDDLALVASYLVQVKDSLTLRQVVRTALCTQAEPGRLHRLLASDSCQALRLFVTTNYDDLLERALEPRAPWIVVDRGTPGNVWCRQAGGEWEETESKNLGYRITDQKRPVVLKLHGSIDRNDREQDSFLITEEHYVDFLGRSEQGQIPPKLFNAMKQRSFLFLGYGLRDWNVRVLLRKLASSRGQAERIQSWAVVRAPSAAEVALWKAQNVDLLDIDVEEFLNALEVCL
jgi:NAD-dependent SIR2 family protein deacetylase